MSQRDVGAADPVVEATGELVKLVDKVVESHAPIVVARDGEPKAALVSMEDYARLKQEAESFGIDKKPSWEEWLARSQEFQAHMIAERGGKPIDRDDVDRARQEARNELEERDSRHGGLRR
jgi:prevent-host-death family protein